MALHDRIRVHFLMATSCTTLVGTGGGGPTPAGGGGEYQSGGNTDFDRSVAFMWL